MTLRAFAAIVWSLTASYAFGGGLNDGDIVDRVLIHSTTRQALLVLSVDLPLTEEANEYKLSHKLSTYVAFVESGQLHAKYPKAKRDVPVVLSFVFELPPPSNVVPKLRAMKERLISKGYEVQMRIYDDKLNKLADFEP